MDSFLTFMNWTAGIGVVALLVYFGLRIKRKLRERDELIKEKRRRAKRGKVIIGAPVPSPSDSIHIPTKFDVIIDAVSSTSGSEQSSYPIPYSTTTKKDDDNSSLDVGAAGEEKTQ